MLMSWELCLLFHLLGVIFNLISSLDDLVWTTVKLVWDDLLKVLEQSTETIKGKCHTPKNQPLDSANNNYVTLGDSLSCFPDLSGATSNVSMGKGVVYVDKHQLSGSGGGSSLRAAAYFASELLLLDWQLCQCTCNIPSMSSWMSSVWFIWRMASPTRNTISRPCRERLTIIPERLVCS